MKNSFSKLGVTAALLISTFASISELKAQNTFPTTGNAGVGTSTPAVPFEVAVTSSVAAKFRNRTISTTADGTIIFDMANSSGNLWRTAVGGKNNGIGINAGQFYIERAGLGSTFLIDQSGQVGIGTIAPAAKLDIAATTYLVGRFKNINQVSTADGSTAVDIANSAGTSFRLVTSGKNNGIGIATNQFYIEKTGTGALFTINTLGNVLIAKTVQTNTSYKLDVNGKIRANEIVVNTTGADFVFADSYKLSTLKEVELFVKANKHLPGIASASEMTEQGMEVGELTKTLLQKVEELTLYIIEQQKQIDSLKANTANN
jgi:hypothetical protein